MAKVQVTNVTVLDNPTAFFNPFQFEITFECLEDLQTGAYMCVHMICAGLQVVCSELMFPFIAHLSLRVDVHMDS